MVSGCKVDTKSKNYQFFHLVCQLILPFPFQGNTHYITTGIKNAQQNIPELLPIDLKLPKPFWKKKAAMPAPLFSGGCTTWLK